MIHFDLKILLLFIYTLSFCYCNAQDDLKEIIIAGTEPKVEPMTGIVFWKGDRTNTDAISLEFSYMLFNEVVKEKGKYNWSKVDAVLDEIAQRKHQAILRFRFTYVGEKTSVPDYIKNLSDYEEIKGSSEGKATWFPDWRNEELQNFTLDFYQKFAQKYDNDPRLAFVQVGFGLWAEYHIYDGPFILGRTFPGKDFQEKFFYTLENSFINTPWSVSIDAADDTYSPFMKKPDLLNIHFGNFDDSFMCKDHSGYNEESWNFFSKNERYRYSPAGGEFSYYSDYDQKHVLDVPKGPYGKPYEEFAKKFKITYMIGNDQPDYQPMSRIKEAGVASGYRFKIQSFKTNNLKSIIIIKNIGVAPVYYDAYPTVNGKRSMESLKGLLPDETKEFLIESGGNDPKFSIECDRLVTGQSIGFVGNDRSLGIADLKEIKFQVYPTFIRNGESLKINNLGHHTNGSSIVKIYSIQGKEVLKKKYYNSTVLNVSSLIGGIYMIVILNTPLYFTKKILIQ